MRIEQLKYLLSLRETLSLTKTAQDYFTSHQVINNSIKSLEQELEIEILERSPKGVKFTDAGLVICNFAKDVIARKEQLHLDLAPFMPTDTPANSGELDINVIPRFANKVFFNFYMNFAKKHPCATMSINTLPAQVFYTRLPLEKPFLFLCTLNNDFIQSASFQKQLTTYHLSYELLVEHKLGICISKNSKYFSQISVDKTLDQLAEDGIPITIFDFSLGESSFVLDKDKSYYIIDSFDSQKELIKSGEYIAYCTPWEYQKFFQSKNQSLIFITPNISPSFYYAVLYDQSQSNNPILIDAIKEIRNFFIQ